jgi:hypothetical protein
MMRKVILCTMVSLFVCGGVLGLSGEGLAGAEPPQDIKAAYGQDATLVIVVKKGAKIELHGAATRKPGGADGSAPPIPSADDKPRAELPTVLQSEITGDTFKYFEIKIYGDKTCGNFGGAWICW